jgi:hypothetical protein
MAEQEIVNYMAKIGVDGSEFTGGIQSMSSSFMAAFGPAGVVVTAIAATATALGAFAIEQGKIAKSTMDLAEITGISTESIQRFHYAAQLSGDSVQMVDALLNKLTLSMGNASDATSAQAKAFKELGISVEGKNAEDVFLDISRALTNLPDKTRAATLAQTLLGKSYSESLPFMKDYIENSKEIENFKGPSDEQLERIAKTTDAWNKLGAATTSVSNDVAIALSMIAFGPGESKKSASTGGVDDYGSGNLFGRQSYTDPYKGMNADAFRTATLTAEATKSLEAYNKGLASGSGDMDKLAKKMHEDQNALDEHKKSLDADTKAQNEKLNAGIAKKLGVDVDQLDLNPDGTPKKWAGGQYKFVGETSQGVSFDPLIGRSEVTTDPTTGRRYTDEQIVKNRSLGAGTAMQTIGMYGATGYDAEIELVKRVLFTGGFNTAEFADLRRVAGGMGTVSAAQGGVKQEWQYSHTADQTASTLREAYSKGLAAAGITINNINNGYATPAEIAAATAKSVSEALAQQATI